MLVIICTKYGKNPSRTVDATERTGISRPRPNDLEDIGQGQRSLYATHPLIRVIICAKYGKNPSRTVDFFFKVKAKKFQKFKFPDSEKNVTRNTPSNDSDHLCQIQKVMAEWPWRYRSRSKVIVCDTPSHGSDHLWLIWKESIQNCRCYRADTAGGTDGRTDRVKPIYPPTTSLFGGYNKQDFWGGCQEMLKFMCFW